MKLSDILNRVREEIDHDDAIREEVLPAARDAVRLCSEAIKQAHRGEYEKSENNINAAYDIINQIDSRLEESPFMSKSKILDVAYQELTEAVNLLTILRDGEVSASDRFDIPSRPYLTGLADVIGELRRATLEALRENDMKRAKKLLMFMEDILDELVSFDYPNALIPDLRRKCDVGRGIVERTRGDVTSAIRQERLIERVQEFERKLDLKERDE